MEVPGSPTFVIEILEGEPEYFDCALDTPPYL